MDNRGWVRSRKNVKFIYRLRRCILEYECQNLKLKFNVPDRVSMYSTFWHAESIHLEPLWSHRKATAKSTNTRSERHTRQCRRITLIIYWLSDNIEYTPYSEPRTMLSMGWYIGVSYVSTEINGPYRGFNLYMESSWNSNIIQIITQIIINSFQLTHHFITRISNYSFSPTTSIHQNVLQDYHRNPPRQHHRC